MVRIVAVADTHTFTDDLRVPDGDIFIHAGDMGRGGDLEELRAVAAWIRTLPHRHKVIVAGNHDWALAPCARDQAAFPAALATVPRARRLGRRPDDNRLCDACRARALDICDPASIEQGRAIFAEWTYLQDGRADLAGISIYGSPWQPEYGGWAFNLPRGPALAEVWSRIPAGLDVVVTHGPPMGIGDRSPTGGRAGCADLRDRIVAARPRLHLFGHIHQDGGAWRHGATMFANVTTWECERPPTVIDLEIAGDAGGALLPIDVPPSGRHDDD